MPVSAPHWEADESPITTVIHSTTCCIYTSYTLCIFTLSHNITHVTYEDNHGRESIFHLVEWTRQLTTPIQPFTIYKYASSGFFALQSIPLLLNPDGIIADLTPKPTGSVKTPSTTPVDNPMARYFARFAGFTSLALSVATLILTDSLGFLLPTRTGNVAGSSKDAAIVISSVYLTSIASLGEC